MKLHEIADAEKWTRLDTLKHLIVSGQQPEIADAFYVSTGFSWGDLEKLGFAKKGSDRQGKADLEWWTYIGPNTIALITQTAAIANGKTTHGRNKQVMKTGDSTSPIEVDYS